MIDIGSGKEGQITIWYNILFFIGVQIQLGLVGGTPVCSRTCYRHMMPYGYLASVLILKVIVASDSDCVMQSLGMAKIEACC